MSPLDWPEYTRMLPPMCYRGCNHAGSMYHTWWTCPHIRSCWNTFFQIVWKVKGVAVPQEPMIALLNHMVDKTPKHTHALLFLMFLGAEITLVGAWKKPKVSIKATSSPLPRSYISLNRFSCPPCPILSQPLTLFHLAYVSSLFSTFLPLFPKFILLA